MSRVMVMVRRFVNVAILVVAVHLDMAHRAVFLHGLFDGLFVAIRLIAVRLVVLSWSRFAVCSIVQALGFHVLKLSHLKPPPQRRVSSGAPLESAPKSCGQP